MTQANHKWIKVWNTLLTDPAMDNLSLDNVGRWVKLLLYVKMHGENGTLTIVEPAKTFCFHMQVKDVNEFKNIVNIFPNIDVFCNGEMGVTKFSVKKWYKYQIDDSCVRVEKFRVCNAQEKEKNKNKNKIRKEYIRKENSTPEMFIEELKKNPAYKGINIERELAKMDAWFLTPKGRKRTKNKAFIVNWLNKIDLPLDYGKGTHEETVADRYKSI